MEPSDVDVYGLDLSLARTGMALADGRVGVLTTKPHERGGGYAIEQRLAEITDMVLTKLQYGDDSAVLVIIEDLPMARAEALALLGMLHGKVRGKLFELSIPFAVVPPSSLKMYATGVGKGPKANMRVSLVTRTRIDIVEENMCDAWWLRAMGKQALGVPVVELPQTHTRGMAKIAWPDVPGLTS